MAYLFIATKQGGDVMSWSSCSFEIMPLHTTHIVFCHFASTSQQSILIAVAHLRRHREFLHELLKGQHCNKQEKRWRGLHVLSSTNTLLRSQGLLQRGAQHADAKVC